MCVRVCVRMSAFAYAYACVGVRGNVCSQALHHFERFFVVNTKRVIINSNNDTFYQQMKLGVLWVRQKKTSPSVYKMFVC